MNKTKSFISGSISLAFYIGIVFAMGKYSDHIGRKKMLLWASISFIALTLPLLYLLSSASFIGIVLIQLIFTLLAMNDGSICVFDRTIPCTRPLSTGFAFSFNTANALLGGTIPLTATWLIHHTGSTSAPAAILIVVSLFTISALLYTQSHRLVSAKV